MRFAGWLLVLAACHTQPAPVSSTPVSMAECPDAKCPEPSCPTCPEPSPPPEAPDWYCHDLQRSNKPASGYCRPSASWCEQNRQDLVRHKDGKPGQCVAQRTAHCFVITDTLLMSLQYMCARTAENCERRRDWVKKNRPEKTDQVSACGETRNTEYFPREDEPFAAPAENQP